MYGMESNLQAWYTENRLNTESKHIIHTNKSAFPPAEALFRLSQWQHWLQCRCDMRFHDFQRTHFCTYGTILTKQWNIKCNDISTLLIWFYICHGTPVTHHSEAYRIGPSKPSTLCLLVSAHQNLVIPIHDAAHQDHCHLNQGGHCLQGYHQNCPLQPSDCLNSQQCHFLWNLGPDLALVLHQLASNVAGNVLIIILVKSPNNERETKRVHNTWRYRLTSSGRDRKGKSPPVFSTARLAPGYLSFNWSFNCWGTAE